MKTLTEQLVRYAACHRDRRNIATHFVGIPMIVAAVAVLLSRPAFVLAGVPLSLAAIVVVLAMAFYLLLDVGLALIMAVPMSMALAFGAWAAAQPTAVWLAIGAGAFVAGFAFQFIGHFYEGRKPAFVDDLASLLVGPLFLVAETLFALGLRRDIQHRIESIAGPTRVGDAGG